MNIKKEYATKLIDWYWQYGCKRKGEYSLARGGWLDRALRLIGDHEAVQLSKTRFAKPTMALWGPSQSGKSTLLARFIDAGADEVGNGGALCWDPSRPARFSGNDKGGKLAVLNPYNQGADASGCVTRFQLQDDVKYQQYPVEVEFASEQEILLSLAVGYLSETTARNRKDEVVQWVPEALSEAVKTATKGALRGAPSKEAYRLLISVLNVVDTLIDMEKPRYVNLAKEWKNRRSTLLNDDLLVSDVESVRKFAAELLWDSWPNMTDVYRKLSSKRKSFENGKRFYCDIRIASLLLNISASSYYRESEMVREMVNRCSLVELDDGACAISQEGGGSRALFRDGTDFALAQGLVSLIIVPLKKDVMMANAPEVANLMSNADLVDFPGVANEHKAAEPLGDSQLSLSYAGPDGKEPLLALTQVLKRGKTASIVVSNARNLNIDVFSLLVRMPAGPAYPAHPQQLMDGIRCWFKSMGQSSNPLSRERRLQINLVLTFSASLLNLVDASGVGVTGLGGVFDKLKSMGDLAAPEIVNPFCINYPQFPDGEIKIKCDGGDIKARKREVIDQILNDRHFRKLFDRTRDCLEEMADLEGERYGGRIYLFREMEKQLCSTQRKALLEEKERVIQRDWDACMSEALPSQTGGSHLRGQDLDMILDAVNKTSLPYKELAGQILSFENIEPDVLEVLPRRTAQLKEYAANQVNLWLESAKRQELQTGLGFANMEHRTRVLGYLSAELNEGETLKEWLTEVDVGVNSDREERKEMRRLVATYMVNILFADPAPHKQEEESISYLCGLGDKELSAKDQESPYYQSVIAPFIRAITALKQSGEGRQRPPQPGDDEIKAILA